MWFILPSCVSVEQERVKEQSSRRKTAVSKTSFPKSLKAKATRTREEVSVSITHTKTDRVTLKGIVFQMALVRTHAHAHSCLCHIGSVFCTVTNRVTLLLRHRFMAEFDHHGKLALYTYISCIPTFRDFHEAPCGPQRNLCKLQEVQN